MVWYSHLSEFPQFVVIYRVEGFGVVNKTEIDVFLELSCFVKKILLIKFHFALNFKSNSENSIRKPHIQFLMKKILHLPINYALFYFLTKGVP